MNRKKIIIILMFFCLLCVSVSLWLANPNPEPPQPDLTEIDPEVAEAIASAQAKVRQRPREGVRWGQLGMVFLIHDFFEEANHCFDQAEHLDPREPRWPYLHGVSLLLHNIDSEAAIPCLQRAVECCGNDPLGPRLRLARTLLHRGRLDEAAFHLQQAHKAQSHDPRVQLDLGRLAILRGQWQLALEHLDACTDDVHMQRLAHTLRAEVWTHLHQPDKARAEQQQAEQAPQDEPWVDPFMAEVARMQRGLPARLQQIHERFARREYSQALRLLEETTKRYPQAPAPWLLAGDVWRQMGRLDRAERAFAEAARLDPQSANAWFHLGCMQAAQHRPRPAVENFQRAIRLKPDHADAHFQLGRRFLELGDTAAAAAAFREALNCRPDHEPARKALLALKIEDRG
jgi:tetratricopeptide (TPR) repeat protein